MIGLSNIHNNFDLRRALYLAFNRCLSTLRMGKMLLPKPFQATLVNEMIRLNL